MNLYFKEKVSVEGDWFSPEDGTTFELKSCYTVDLSEIFAACVVASECNADARKQIFEIFNIIKSHTEERLAHRKMIITFSENGAAMSDYVNSFFKCDLTGYKNVFVLEMNTDEEENHLVVTLLSLDLIKHNKARFIANELSALCRKVNPNIKSLEYYFAEETDIEKRLIKDDEYCMVTFTWFTKNVLITADSLSSITIDVLNKI